MADKPKMDEETRRKGMLDALNKGISEANGTMTDHELVLIKRAKKKLKAKTGGALGNISDKEKAALAKANSKAVASKTGGMLGKAVGAITDREQQLLDAEQ